MPKELRTLEELCQHGTSLGLHILETFHKVHTVFNDVAVSASLWLVLIQSLMTWFDWYVKELMSMFFVVVLQSRLCYINNRKGRHSKLWSVLLSIFSACNKLSCLTKVIITLSLLLQWSYFVYTDSSKMWFNKTLDFQCNDTVQHNESLSHQSEICLFCKGCVIDTCHAQFQCSADNSVNLF